MKHILIIGANGQLARNTTRLLLERDDVELTLYLRRSHRLQNPDLTRVRIVEGDATDIDALARIMPGHDVVYANLAGDMPTQARCIVEAMARCGLQRLVFISSMGIYGEVPGQHYDSILDPYRDSANVVESSSLDYTVVRPGWFSRGPAGALRITHKGEPFIGHDINLDTLSSVIVDLTTSPGKYVRQSIGVSDR